MSVAAGRASVVGGDERYEMFDVAELDERGARLVGPLLLEVGEEVTLRMPDQREVRVRVTRVERGEREAATLVTFVSVA
jgi:hypothetical protein